MPAPKIADAVALFFALAELADDSLAAALDAVEAEPGLPEPDDVIMPTPWLESCMVADMETCRVTLGFFIDTFRAAFTATDRPDLEAKLAAARPVRKALHEHRPRRCDRQLADAIDRLNAAAGSAVRNKRLDDLRRRDWPAQVACIYLAEAVACLQAIGDAHGYIPAVVAAADLDNYRSLIDSGATLSEVDADTLERLVDDYLGVDRNASDDFIVVASAAPSEPVGVLAAAV